MGGSFDTIFFKPLRIQFELRDIGTVNIRCKNP